MNVGVNNVKKALKDTQCKLISELMKNSRRSDRELSKAVGVSQPTVSRMIKKLEDEGYIQEYTMIPNFGKLGYEIIAVTSGKRDYAKHPENLIQVARNFVKQHPNIIFAADGNGLDYDVISISIHKDYSDYSKVISEARGQAGEAMKADSFLIDTSREGIVQPLSMKRFAEQLVKKQG